MTALGPTVAFQTLDQSLKPMPDGIKLGFLQIDHGDGSITVQVPIGSGRYRLIRMARTTRIH